MHGSCTYTFLFSRYTFMNYNAQIYDTIKSDDPNKIMRYNNKVKIIRVNNDQRLKWTKNVKKLSCTIYSAVTASWISVSSIYFWKLNVHK